MMKKTRHPYLLIGVFVTLIGFLFTTFFSVAAYIRFLQYDSGAFGTIGLRSYFDSGTGEETDPYVITRPRHLFNLSRLQSLGVFSEKTYFQLGKKFDGSDEFKVYTGDSSNETCYALDMTGYDGEKGHETISNIGNEATPFYGEFEGNGLEIKNVTVQCSLEDSGLFGYVASKGEIRNLLLDNVTIINDGYPASYKDLYSDDADSALKKGSSFVIQQGSRNVKYSYDDNLNTKIEDTASQVYNSDMTLSFEISTEPSSSQDKEDRYQMPTFSLGTSFDSNSNYGRYSYSLLPSDDFFTLEYKDGRQYQVLKEKGNDIHDIFSLFASYDTKENKDSYFPLNLAMTMSLVADYLDNEGINHSKVVQTLNISFEKLSSSSKFITMKVQPRSIDHGNNMGLVIGHLDGSLKNVYVHDGTFKMNTNSANNRVDQNSMTGFIGLVGPSVANIQSSGSKGNAAIAGKDVGVLDFTDIYDSVVGDSTFSKRENSKYYEYTPVTGNDYMEYLRVDTNGKYVTAEQKQIALKGQKIIQDDDTHNRGLGVFKVATNYAVGDGDSWANGIDKSTITQSKTGQEGTSPYKEYDSKNIFFSTYEYQKQDTDTDTSIKNLIDTLKNNTSLSSPAFLPGNHIPLETTKENQRTYEKYYNYLFRFALDGTSDDFYFNDLDVTSIGGSFLTNYLSYKLVDSTGSPIEPGSSTFGLMIKDKKRKNIAKLTTNFLLDSSDSMYILDSKPEAGNYSISNSINFEIKTEKANVTILASDESKSKQGSMLGVYKLPDAFMKKDSLNVPKKSDGKELTWTEPDYGMVLPKTQTISFFEYDKTRPEGEKIGSAELGEKYYSDSQIVTKDYNKASRVNTDTKDDFSSFSNYIGSPIYAHTFTLPKGRYCLGSAIGKAFVYYVCAQGQDNGDLSLSANIFSETNRVENVDFLMESGDTMHNKNLPYFSIQDSVVKPNDDTLNSNRCFVIFDSANTSHFRASTKNNEKDEFILVMKYEKDQLNFTSDSNLQHIESLTLQNYRKIILGNTYENTVVNLFGTPYSTTKISYITA